MPGKKRKLKIGIALSGGTAKGFAHLGVLKVLEKNGIKPDVIAGTSAGAVIGALYASGMKPDLIARMLTNVDWKDIFDFGVPRSGLIKGEKIENFLEQAMQGRDFEDLVLPFFVVGTNLTKREKVIFCKGSVAKALRVGIAIPGIFEPVEIDGDTYVDGAIVDPVPVDVLKENGADVIIVVDVGSTVVKSVKKGVKRKDDFMTYMKKKLVVTEVGFFKEFLKAKELAKGFIPKVLQNFFKKVKHKLIDWFVKPTVAFQYIGRSKIPKILSVMYESTWLMKDEYAKEALKSPLIDVIIMPKFREANWVDFNKAPYFMKRGALAAKRELGAIKRIIRSR